MAVSRIENRPINPDLGMPKAEYTKAIITISLVTGLVAGAILSQLPMETYRPSGTGNFPALDKSK